MIILSPICLAAGLFIAGLAPKRPVHQAIIEATGGALMVAGLAIIGAGLPIFQ